MQVINDKLTFAAVQQKAKRGDRMVMAIEYGDIEWSGVYHVRCLPAHALSLPARVYSEGEPLDAEAVGGELAYFTLPQYLGRCGHCNELVVSRQELGLAP
jgi:hypothetical protein